VPKMGLFWHLFGDADNEPLRKILIKVQIYFEQAILSLQASDLLPTNERVHK